MVKAVLFLPQDTGKYHPAEVDGKIYMVNTRDAVIEMICDKNLKCKSVESTKDEN